MPGLGPMLDVAIGLVVVYTLFASLLSVVFEAVASMLGLRSRALENAIVSLLEDAPAPGKGLRAFVDKFTGLFGSLIRLRNERPPTGVTPLSKRVYDHPLIGGTSVKNKPSYISAEHFAAALLAELRKGGDAATSLASQIEQGVYTLADHDSLRAAMTTIIADAQGDWDKIRAGVEGWFDSAMKRLTGDYKRFHQVCTFVAGLFLAVLCNVDSVKIVREFYLQPELARVADGEAAIVAAAQSKTPGCPPSTSPSQPIQCVGANIAAIDQARALLLRGDLPVGWDKPPSLGAAGLDATTVLAWLPSVIGWLITALAGMLGAPFWFDSLQKLVNLRGAGPKPTDPASPAGLPA